jgi:hypothetical protein
VCDYLPEARREYVARQLRDSYASATAATAKKKLVQPASWLDSNGHTDAAASLRARASTRRSSAASADAPCFFLCVFRADPGARSDGTRGLIPT